MTQVTTGDKQKVVLDKEQFASLKQKAAFLDELLSFIEDKNFGSLMQDTEKEKDISLPEAEKILKQEN